MRRRQSPRKWVVKFKPAVADDDADKNEEDTKVDEGCAQKKRDSDECGVSDDGHAESSCAASLRGGSSVCDTDVCDFDGVAEDGVFSPAFAALRDFSAGPLQQYYSETNPHAYRNNDHEVGNFGIYLGNWGQRSFVNEHAIRRRRQVHDLQILKCPAPVVVLCETTIAVQHLLESPALRPTDPAATGLQGRKTHEHWVVRGNEEKGALLIAVRKDTCSELSLLDHLAHLDVYHNEKKQKNRGSVSRFLTCAITFKQNIGHLGNQIVVCGVHGNQNTMKMHPKEPWNTFFDLLAQRIVDHKIQFLAGDFNMSVTQVPVQLRSRGFRVDCVAWYPWMHHSTHLFDQYLGFDSMAIFYIGGIVEVKMVWDLGDIHILAAVAGTEDALWKEKSDDRKFDVFSDVNNVPGQPWKCYRSVKYNEKNAHKDLRARLTELLTPSTSPDQLETLRKDRKTHYAPYLRIKERRMSIEEWLVDGNLHKGAHFPLCIFTNNARARSEEAAKRRYHNAKLKGKGKGEGTGKGKEEGEG